jgi:hypothetical protein
MKTTTIYTVLCAILGGVEDLNMPNRRSRCCDRGPDRGIVFLRAPGRFTSITAAPSG